MLSRSQRSLPSVEQPNGVSRFPKHALEHDADTRQLKHAPGRRLSSVNTG